MAKEQDCGFYIKHINDALQREANNALRGKDLTVAQVAVLHQLNDTPGNALPLKELEKRLYVAQSTAAGIIVRLEQKGFVEGFGDPEDKRIKMVRITPAGKECCEASQFNIRQSEAYLLSGLTETEQAIFRALLKKVSESMR